MTGTPPQLPYFIKQETNRQGGYVGQVVLVSRSKPLRTQKEKAR